MIATRTPLLEHWKAQFVALFGVSKLMEFVLLSHSQAAALNRIFLINGEAVMLVISRRQGESVWIGDQIKIVVCTMRGKRVSLGIAAPRDVSVVRDELRQADLDKALAASGLTDRTDLEITQTDLLG